MRVKKITKNIFHINFYNQQNLCLTFLRFQEYFESPKFKGEIFTLKEYTRWYISNSLKGKKTGKFTYCKDWSGFNIPSEILEPFYLGKFNPLSKKEKKLLDLFKKKRGDKFYIIATLSPSLKSALKHEIAHGLFYTNPRYKKDVLKILRDVKKEKIEKIHSYLSQSGGYHKDVWDDETQAYIISGLNKLKKYGFEVSGLSNISKKLNFILKKYAKDQTP